jgi:hypothetical protein
MDATCCYIVNQETHEGCPKPAEWEIWDSPGPCGDTLACSDHVGHLLSDGPEHRVYPYGRHDPEEQAEPVIAREVTQRQPDTMRATAVPGQSTLDGAPLPPAEQGAGPVG